MYRIISDNLIVFTIGSNHHPSNSGKINDFLSPFADQVRKERVSVLYHLVALPVIYSRLMYIVVVVNFEPQDVVSLHNCLLLVFNVYSENLSS